MNEVSKIEVVQSAFTHDFLLIQEVGFLITIIFLIYNLKNQMIDDVLLGKSRLKNDWLILTFFFIFGSTSFLIYEWGFDRSLFAIIFSISIALAMLKPAYGLCCFMAFLFYRPWEMLPLDPIVLSIPKYFGIFVIAMTLLKKIREEEYYFIWNRELKYFLLFSFWLLITTIKTSNLNESIANYNQNFTKAIILLVLIINLIETKLDFNAFVGTLVITITTKGIVSLYNTILDPISSEGRLKGFGALADPNDLASLFIVVIPLCWGFFTHYKNKFLILYSALISIIGIYLIWSAKSRGALIALISLGVTYFFRIVKKKSYRIIFIIFAISLFLPLTSMMKRSSSDLEESSSNRLNYWKTAVNMAFRNPILGVGFNSYPENYERYAPEILGEYGHRTAHSTWFLILGEAGPIGLLLFLMMFYEIAKKAILLRNRKPEILYAFIGYSITMTFLSHPYIIYPYILLGLVSASARIYEI